MTIKISIHGLKRLIHRAKTKNPSKKVEKAFYSGFPREKIPPSKLRQWVDGKFYSHGGKKYFQYKIFQDCLYIFGPVIMFDEQNNLEMISGYELVTVMTIPNFVRIQAEQKFAGYKRKHKRLCE